MAGAAQEDAWKTDAQRQGVRDYLASQLPQHNVKEEDIPVLVHKWERIAFAAATAVPTGGGFPHYLQLVTETMRKTQAQQFSRVAAEFGKDVASCARFLAKWQAEVPDMMNAERVELLTQAKTVLATLKAGADAFVKNPTGTVLQLRVACETVRRGLQAQLQWVEERKRQLAARSEAEARDAGRMRVKAAMEAIAAVEGETGLHTRTDLLIGAGGAPATWWAGEGEGARVAALPTEWRPAAAGAGG
eukprot:CAMPEP_0203828534 /NCGR_PEP_ID=MMETSP0115-20131106/61436_1 /ASSEMBLY_ACC=CAM_ASM_000227 /TAXON_ID=33651 /ORGANISM="Bicosoecid sp, Strain ms1" /LENGTH=245 /DNA_ID=CAMNT_0050737593 /DNA_START=18 /DNA_END=752 /DNA_ORIENTATION=-